MLAGSRIIDSAVAGQLIGLLAMLAPALSIALAGEAAIAAVWASDQAQRQSEIDIGQCVCDALTLLLGSARGQNHRGRRAAQQVSGLEQRAFRHAGNALNSLRPVHCRHGLYLREALGARLDILVINEIIANENMQ